MTARAEPQLTDTDRHTVTQARALAALRGGAALRAHAGTGDTMAAMVIAIGEAQYLLADLVAIVERLGGGNG